MSVTFPADANGLGRRAPVGGAPAGVSVAKALGSSTRAEIYEHLKKARAALAVRDVAAVFELHPNVARTHLETLADAGLVVVGRRKNPAGGRPAKLYLARQQAASEAQGADAAGGRPHVAVMELLVRLLGGLLEDSPAASAGGRSLLSRAFEAAAAEGRRLVAGFDAGHDGRGLDAAAQTAMRALRA
ncbi:MAG: helix-turn-helix domain-containing protein, partial [Actinomycetota bacterium]|nr:helix-turn-helix domain-containing protein [Actinomycetota bacterium]